MASSRKPDPGVALKVGLLDAAAALAESAGAKGPFLLTPLPGGTNNQVYRLDGTRFSGLLKAYYAGPGDRRDRLGVEFGFCRVAWSSGVKAVPRPLAMDPRRRLGLYEFIEGRPPRPGSGPPRPAQADLGQALRFLLALNAPRVRRAAGALPPASDACFSLARHLDCVDRRLSALSAARASSAVEK
ncbi:MAG: phosphotransferase, partial [Elusimicrobia bacterium]|nr:phosphotransferase [Elusimicrobiota bacterium]